MHAALAALSGVGVNVCHRSDAKNGITDEDDALAPLPLDRSRYDPHGRQDRGPRNEEAGANDDQDLE